MPEAVLSRSFWDAAPESVEVRASPLPDRVDALMVGAGYTGLAAARETAVRGALTLVLDAGDPGAGCSGRNGGQVAYSIKPSYEQLRRVHGASRAFAICREGHHALAHLRALAELPGFDCGWRASGCFFGAHTARRFTAMAREAADQTAGLEQRISVVSKADQHREIGSDFYHGGCVYHDDASLDPMLLLKALLRRALDAGATVQGGCPVLGIRRGRGGFDVSTPRGSIRARQVLLATNGHSGALLPWLRRRVVPIGSYQIATEALDAGMVRSLIPRGRNVVDSRRVVVYFRPSPDGRRIIFGGRAALAERNALACVPRLRDMLTQIFPQLRGVRIAQAWVGWVAYTFDTLPHLGQHEGIHYCAGYCGQGVPLAPYFGMRIGQQMAGLAEGRTALDGLAFPSRPYYFGRPWFLAPSIAAYRTLDAFGA